MVEYVRIITAKEEREGGVILGVLAALIPPIIPLVLILISAWHGMNYENIHPLFRIIFTIGVAFAELYTVWQFYKHAPPIFACVLTASYFVVCYAYFVIPIILPDECSSFNLNDVWLQKESCTSRLDLIWTSAFILVVAAGGYFVGKVISGEARSVKEVTSQ